MPHARRSPSEHGLGVVVGGFAFVRVRGASMEPTLRDGDLLLVRVDRTPVPGALVVLELPGRVGLAIKRVVRLEPDGWWVERDNPREGVDSWAIGAIPAADVVAQVVRRLWPLRRIGGRPRL
ncbi:MAG: S24 family peptidase [Actinomycetia bacterium]|nr:S24 family peptidase [Actinomycetes bacterium]